MFILSCMLLNVCHRSHRKVTSLHPTHIRRFISCFREKRHHLVFERWTLRWRRFLKYFQVKNQDVLSAFLVLWKKNSFLIKMKKTQFSSFWQMWNISRQYWPQVFTKILFFLKKCILIKNFFFFWKKLFYHTFSFTIISKVFWFFTFGRYGRYGRQRYDNSSLNYNNHW